MPDEIDRRLLRQRQRPDGVVLAAHASRATQSQAFRTPVSSWPTPSSSTSRSSTTGNHDTHRSGCSARSSTSAASPRPPPAIKQAERANPGHTRASHQTWGASLCHSARRPPKLCWLATADHHCSRHAGAEFDPTQKQFTALRMRFVASPLAGTLWRCLSRRCSRNGRNSFQLD